jgi:hypothetical protein
MRDALRFSLLTVVCLTGAACRSERDAHKSLGMGSSPARSARAEPDLDDVQNVSAQGYPYRTYFYGQGDTAHVYWFDTRDSSSWIYRPVYRENGRAYVLERDGDRLTRIWFDENRATDYDWSRDGRGTEPQRERMRTLARNDWTRREPDESSWRTRWSAAHPSTPAAYGSVPASRPDKLDGVDTGRTVDVGAGAYPDRTYFFDRGDPNHVFWFDKASPNSWTYRPIYRESGKAYYLEREAGSLKRYSFDENRAKEFDFDKESRWTVGERSTMRTAARDEWTRRERVESTWRARWEKEHPEAKKSSWDTGAAKDDADSFKVVEVRAGANPERIYFRDENDATHVYWFDASNPKSWSYRPSYRDGGRAYLLERDGDVVRRVWFDDRRAYDFDLDEDSRFSAAERTALRSAARDEWTRRQRDENAWRNRWEREHPRRDDVNLGAVTDVSVDSEPDRSYFFDRGDTNYVYWFEPGAAASTWHYGPVYREGKRAYVLVRDDDDVKRYWIDEKSAREFDWTGDTRWTDRQREKMRESAKRDWKRRETEESAWRSRWTREHPDTPSSAGDVDLDKVVDVSADSTPSRTYFFDKGDVNHAYWFDAGSPSSWHYGDVYREGAKTYVLVREGGAVKRYWFEEKRAKDFDWQNDARWTEEQRAQMREAARSDWTRRRADEAGWRARWEQRNRR